MKQEGFAFEERARPADGHRTVIRMPGQYMCVSVCGVWHACVWHVACMCGMWHVWGVWHACVACGMRVWLWHACVACGMHVAYGTRVVCGMRVACGMYVCGVWHACGGAQCV